MDTVEVERVSDDGLTRETWRFNYHYYKLKASDYVLQERPTTRHKFRNVKLWDRTNNRHYLYYITIDEVPKPDDVLEEAHRRFVEKITAVWA